MSSTFCPIPWIFQAVRSNGDMRICCQANVTKNKGVLRKADGTAFNAGKDSLSSSRNSDLMIEVRKNMINGKWSEECGRCKIEEENGLISRRKYEQDKNLYSFSDAEKDTNLDGTIDTEQVPIQYYDLRFGNFCNLKCRMCGPTDSNAWYEDWVSLTNTMTFNESSGPVTIREIDGKFQTDQYSWPSYEPFWNNLEQNISNIRYVYFAGGEPMLIERHYDFLERCVKAGTSQNISIEYNTNMSTIPTRILNLWDKFKHVNIGASVDGYKEILEYQRNPANWEKVYNNLQKIDQLPDNVYAWLAVTVTAYNVNHIVDFMKWKLLESGFKKINSSNKRRIITHHIAHHPKHLNIRVLPDEMKMIIVQRYKEFVIWVKENNFDEHDIKRAEEITASITKYMLSDSYYQSDWKHFVDYTNKLDLIRGEQLADVEPLFFNYLNRK